MKRWNKDKIKRSIKRSVVLLFCLGIMLPLMHQDATAFDAAEVVSKIERGILYLFKWTPLLDGDNARSGSNYVTMLNEKGKTIRGTDQVHSGPDEAQIYVHGNYTPYSFGRRSSSDVFYTLGSMGAPIICRKGDDGDNNGYEHAYWLADEEYPYAPRQAIKRNGGGDWDEFANYYAMDLTGDSRYDKWIDDFCDGKSGYNYNYSSIDVNQYDAPSYFTLSNVSDIGKFMIFKNISNKRDPAWQCYDNGRIWCDQESDNSDRCYFNIWYGDPVKYSTLTQSYAIGNGQTLTLDSEAESYRGIYIPPTATLKVEKGGTLAINETVFNDGTILCDGGTVIIQGNGSLSPMSRDDSDYNKCGKNKIIIQNGGALIVMPGGKLYTTSAHPMVLINSRMINFGSYLMGGNLELYASTIENRESGKVLSGYNVKADYMRPVFENAKISVVEAGNDSNIGYTNSYSTIVVYDMQENLDNLKWLVGNPIQGALIDPHSYTDASALKTVLQTAISNNSKNLNQNFTTFTTT